MLKRDPRKSYHHGGLEEAMVREGMAEVEREGLTRLSMRRVAEQLDVSSAAPWHHFKKGRTSFSAAIAEAGFSKMRVQLEKRRSADKTPVENLGAVFEAYTRFAIDNPGLYRTMFSHDVSAGLESVNTGDRSEDRHILALLAEKAWTFKVFVDLVSEGQRANQLRGGDPALLARVVTSLAHGLSLEFIDEQLARRTSRRKEAAALFSMLLDGLGSNRRHVRVLKMKDEDEFEDYRELSAAEKLAMVKELSDTGYALNSPPNAESGSSRSNIRVFKRKR